MKTKLLYKIRKTTGYSKEIKRIFHINYIEKPTLYLETSLFGFYFDETPRNVDKFETVNTLFNQIEQKKFLPVTSPITYYELSKSPEPYKTSFLELLNNLKVNILKTKPEEVEILAAKYIKMKIIPEDFLNDARHIAYASIEKVDVMVTLNLEHIANEWAMRKINGINLQEGYLPLTVRTPMEVIIL